MIARPPLDTTEQREHPSPEMLARILNEDLTGEQAAALEDHLDRCETCQRTLQTMAGDQQWWSETVRTLTPVVPPKNGREETASEPGRDRLDAWDHSLTWLRPLLQPSSGSGLGRLDQYPIDAVIGHGGMGVVLRGIDPSLGRPVAIKVLAPHLAGVGAARRRFRREAQSIATIVHPSIVPIYSVSGDSQLPYLVMPEIAGGNLQQRIDREGPLPLEELLRIGVQIAEGLAAAHRQGVIHRDIKPANVLLEAGNGRALISDFGIARARDDATLTASGIVTGTPQYMSPEQARGDDVDARSDLFSLGSLLYAAATGRPPFRADSPLVVLRQISERSAAAVHEVNECLPPWVDRLIKRLMTIDVDRRIPSADQAAELLRLAHLHVANPGRNPLPGQLQTRRSARTTLKWMAAAMLTPLGAIPLVWGLPEHQVQPVAPPVFSKAAPPWNDPAMDDQFHRLHQEIESLEQQIIFPPQGVH